MFGLEPWVSSVLHSKNGLVHASLLFRSRCAPRYSHWYAAKFNYIEPLLNIVRRFTWMDRSWLRGLKGETGIDRVVQCLTWSKQTFHNKQWIEDVRWAFCVYTETYCDTIRCCLCIFHSPYQPQYCLIVSRKINTMPIDCFHVAR